MILSVHGIRLLSFLFKPPATFLQQLRNCDSAFHVERLILQKPDFSNHELAASVSTLGKKRSTNRQVIARLLKLIHTRKFTEARDLSTCLYGLATGRMVPFAPRQLTNQLLEYDLNKFNSQDYANTLWALAKFKSNLEDESHNRQVLQRFQVSLESRKHLNEFTSAELANTLWALASSSSLLSSPTTKLEEQFSLEIERRSLVKFNSQDISNHLWSFAVLGHRQTRIYSLLAKELVENREWKDFTSQAICNIAWALAKSGYKHPVLFDSIADEVIDERSIQAFTPQGLSMLAWAFARLDYDSPRLFILLGEAMQRGRKFPPHSIVNTVWAYAKLGKGDEHLFQHFSEEIQHSIQPFKPNELATICWSFATCKIMDLNLFQHLLKAITHQSIQEFSPKDVCNIVWSFAVLNVLDVDLLNKLVLGQDLTKFTSIDLSTLAWSFATLRIQNIELFNQIAQLAMTQSQTLSSQVISNLLWAFATVKHPQSELMFNALGREICNRHSTLPSSEFNDQALSNIVWAFAETQNTNPQVFKIISNEVVSSQRNLKDFSILALTTILHSFNRCGYVDVKLGEVCAKEMMNRNWLEVSSSHAIKFLSSLAAMGIDDPMLWKSVIEKLNFSIFTIQEKLMLLKCFIKGKQQQVLPCEWGEIVMHELLLVNPSNVGLWANGIHTLSEIGISPHADWLGELCHQIANVTHPKEEDAFKDLTLLAWELNRLGVHSTNPAFVWLGKAMANRDNGLLANENNKSLIQAFTCMPTMQTIVEHELLNRDLSKLSARDMSIAVHHAPQSNLALLGVEPHLLAHPERLQEFSPRNLAVLLTAWTSEGHSELFHRVATYLTSQSNTLLLHKFPPKLFTNVVWAFARSKNFSIPLMEHAAIKFDSDVLAELSSRDLHDLFFAFSKTKHTDLVERIANTILLLEQEMTPAQSAFVIKGLAQHRLTHCKAFMDLSLRLCNNNTLGQFEVKLLRKMLWALASSQANAPELFSALVQEMEARNLQDYSAKDMGLMVRALALNQMPIEPLCKAFIQELLHRRSLQQLSNNDLVFLLNRFSTVGFTSTEFYATIADELCARGLATLPNEHITLILWSLCQVNVRAPKLFAMASKEVQSRTQFTARELKQVMLSFADQGNNDVQLFEFCQRRIAQL
ncbi:hypothetical protein BASA81_009869 [Batrachochytrium salamandrivorans]|nr:hypothetical protein BASA81_009869 [Batrachochytrium salamandrivorans]